MGEDYSTPPHTMRERDAKGEKKNRIFKIREKEYLGLREEKESLKFYITYFF